MEKRLGKGLEALIPEDMSKPTEKIARLKISEIIPNAFQPRTVFKPEAMDDLKRSIEGQGVIQPVLVRLKDNVYELIAGERRWRAAKALNLEEIPAIIRKDVDDVSSLELSLVENIQREELNPIEEARAYKKFVEKFEYTLETIGQMVGKDKTTISNALRLLRLPEEIQRYIEEETLTTGHAKALLSIQNEHKQKKIAQTIIKHGLSVRQTEQFISAAEEPAKQKRETQKDPEVLRIEEELQHHLGTKVRIIAGKKRGHIEIQYFSNEDLDRLLKLILPR